MLLIIFTGIIAFLLCYVLFKPMDYWKKRGVLHMPAYPIVGNSGSFVLRKKHLAEILQNIYNLQPHTRYVGMFQFSKRVLMIRDLDLIKQICVKDFDHFTDRLSFIPRESDLLLGRMLASLPGEEWREMRATLSPAFTSAKMKNMFIFISECAENFTQFFIKNKEASREIELKDIFSRFTTDIIASTNFGLKCDSLEDPENDFYKVAKLFSNFGALQNIRIFFVQALPRIARALNIFVISLKISNFFRKTVHSTIAQREAENIVRPDMLHLLNEARKGKLAHENLIHDSSSGFATVEESEIGKEKLIRRKELTNDDITAQAMMFFLAGFDTSSTMLGFVVYELTLHVEVQEKLHEEIDEVLRNAKDGKLTYEALIKMKYLDQIISESLRKWPVGFQTDRICVKDYVIQPVLPDETPLVVEKGVLVIFPIMPIHRDPKYWADPENFDPERFSDDNKKNIISGTYMPFGVGPRNCIGSRFALMTIKCLIFHLLANFELVPTEKTPRDFKINPKAINISSQGIFVELKPRNVTKL